MKRLVKCRKTIKLNKCGVNDDGKITLHHSTSCNNDYKQCISNDNITVHLAKNDEGPSNGTSGSSRRGLTCPKVEKNNDMYIRIGDISEIFMS